MEQGFVGAGISSGETGRLEIAVFVEDRRRGRPNP
jgi:hypothetical protein